VRNFERKRWENSPCDTICIQSEWLFYIMLSGVKLCHETVTKVTLTPSRARGHVPTLLQITGHGGTESKKNKKQESDQTVLTTRKRLPKRRIVLVKPKKVEGTTKNFRRFAPYMCLPLLNSFQRRWIGLHRLHRHHHRLVHKTV